MLTPAVSQNVALTNFSLRYAPGQFIGDLALPIIPVSKVNGNAYYIYGKENLRDENDGPLGQKSPAGERDFNVTSTTVDLHRYALKDMVTREEQDEADAALDPKEDTVAGLMDDILISKERRAAALLFNTSNLTQNDTLSGTGQFSDYTSGVSDPIGVIETAKDTVVDSARVSDDMLKVIMGIDVWRKVRHHPDVVERYKYTAGGGVTKQQFADLIGVNVENLLIGVAGYDSADEGQTASMANIWGKHLVVEYVPSNPGLRSRTLAATFQKTSHVEVSEWPNNDPAGDNVRVESYYNHAIIDATLGYMVENAVA